MKVSEVDLNNFEQFYTYLSKDVPTVKAYAKNGLYLVIREKSTQKLYINNSRPFYTEITNEFLTNKNY
jgi:hypothetical protein